MITVKETFVHVSVTERKVAPYFVMRTFLEKVNSMEGNEKTEVSGKLIQWLPQ